MTLLEIKNLAVEVEGKRILEDINLSIEEGKTMVFFGPNGSGKTTLLMAIAGYPDYDIVNGQILLNGEDITHMGIDERVNRGLGVGFQLPPEITGVKLKDLIKICSGQEPGQELNEEERRLIEKLNLKKFIDRDINKNFSGGEKKRAEMLQMLLMKPQMLLLDEPDSGVDVESLRLLSEELKHYLDESNASSLIITHHGDILKYLDASSACVMIEGQIWCRGEPKKIYEEILEKGYKKCVECQVRHPEEKDE